MLAANQMTGFAASIGTPVEYSQSGDLAYLIVPPSWTSGLAAASRRSGSTSTGLSLHRTRTQRKRDARCDRETVVLGRVAVCGTLGCGNVP
jgi:hypothetical protein